MSIRSFKRARARREVKQSRRATILARRGRLIAGGTLAASALMAGSAQAATTYTVNNSGDPAANAAECKPSPPDANACTLRDALAAAVDGDTINFDMSKVTSPITLSGALPVTQKGLTIQGPGASSLTISGADTSQVFNITTPESTAAGDGVTISGLTLTHGKASGPGGAVSWNPNTSFPNQKWKNAQPLTLSNDVISNSQASNNGGGVYSSGPLSISGSTVTGNTAPTGGGIDSLVSNNPGQPGEASVPLAVTNSTVSGNHATAGSGGGINTKYLGFGSGAPPTTITGSHITNNSATASNKYGSGNGGGIFALGGALAVHDSTVTGNQVTGTGFASGHGGAISSHVKYGTTITGTTLSGNIASAGGGGVALDSLFPPQFQSLVKTQKYSPVTIAGSTVSGNTAPDGAGIEVQGASYGSPMKIDQSTISGNQGGPSSFGGGIALDALIEAPVTVRDSTISGNSATNGGGVSLGNGSGYEQFPTKNGKTTGSVRFADSTISGNTATTHGGGIYLGAYTAGSVPTFGPPPPPQPKTSGGSATIDSTIVSGNKVAAAPEDLERAAAATNPGGFTGSFSLVQAPGTAMPTGTSNIIGKDPKLGPLANNGGPTQTMSPAGDSPVIDQGHRSSGLATDQIGNARTVDTAVPNPPGGDGTDIGAVELSADKVIYTPPTVDPGFRVGIRTTLTLPGSPLGTGIPLLVGDQTPVTCTVQTGSIQTCAIELRIGNKVIASGGATDRLPTNSITTLVNVNAVGLRLIGNHPLGVTVPATGFGDAQNAHIIDGPVHFLPRSAITLPIVGRSATLTKGLLGQLAQAASLLSQTKSVTCTAYTDQAPTQYVIRGTGHHRHRVALPNTDTALTRAQAKAACAALAKDGLKAHTTTIGRGHLGQVALNRTASGRAQNRRLVISFGF